ncbi:MAG: zinc ribbon domain-containing protein [Pseudomonadota bacterium]|nr:zinc ribbon domain-containing protein [Pseudomonadota bacterium]
MPIYEYKCESCGHQLEALQKMSDAALTDCPACQASQLKKLISASGFQLKGSGWYETDFKGGKAKTEKPAPATSSGSAAE